MALNWKELVGDDGSITTSGFSNEGGRSTGLWSLDNPTALDLVNSVTDLLGSTGTVAADITSAATSNLSYGKVNRTLPKAHPQYPWLYCSAIQKIKGTGDYTKAVPVLSAQSTTPISGFALYEKYFYEVEFRDFPGKMLANAAVPIGTCTYHDGSGGAPITIRYAQEFYRFTSITQTPRQDFAVATQGAMAFRTSDGSAPGGTPFADAPRMLLPNQNLTVSWGRVPYRFVTSPKSYFSMAIGTVNQNEFWGYAPGSLLFMGCTPSPYTPPIPATDLGNFNTATLTESILPWVPGVSFDYCSIDNSRLCNIDLHFILTNRQGTKVPTPVNKNWIAAGHNLAPWWATRGWYYPSSVPPKPNEGNTSLQRPQWLSFPHELLFTDPDYPTVGTDGVPVTIRPPVAA